MDGKSKSQNDVHNNYGGKLYRVNHDGSDCICIYDNPAMYFYDNSIMIYEDTILIYASECGMKNGYAQIWAEGVYIGTINEDGTIDSLEWVEVIA